MPIHRSKKNGNYSVMCNHHFQERHMTLKAKGLLSLVLSLSDTWNFSLNGLVALSQDKECSVRSALNELEHNGYLRRYKTRDAKGQYVTVYDFFELPPKRQKSKEDESRDSAELNDDSDDGEEPHMSHGVTHPTSPAPDAPQNGESAVDEPPVENPPLENRLHNNNELYSTNISNTEKIESTRAPAKQNIPTLDEIKAFCAERNSTIDPERFFAYNESVGWMRGRTPITNWKAAIKAWESTERRLPPNDKESKEHAKKAKEVEDWFDRRVEMVLGDCHSEKRGDEDNTVEE